MSEPRNRTEYMRQYRASHQDQFKQYYEDTKQATLERVQQQIMCDVCGCQSTIHSLPRHKRSKKCKSFIKQ